MAQEKESISFIEMIDCKRIVVPPESFSLRRTLKIDPIPCTYRISSKDESNFTSFMNSITLDPVGDGETILDPNSFYMIISYEKIILWFGKRHSLKHRQLLYLLWAIRVKIKHKCTPTCVHIFTLFSHCFFMFVFS